MFRTMIAAAIVAASFNAAAQGTISAPRAPDAGPCVVGAGGPCNPTDDRVERAPPVPVVTYSDPRGNAVAAILNDGTLTFDYGGTIAWSRFFVVQAAPSKCRPAWVLTWINGPGERRPFWLQGCEPVNPKE